MPGISVSKICVPFGGGGIDWSSYWEKRTPSDLMLTVLSDTSIKLDWTANGAQDYDGYSVERSTDGATYAEVDTVAVGTETYTDTELTADTLYYYRVRAYKGGAYSNYTNIAEGGSVLARFKANMTFWSDVFDFDLNVLLDKSGNGNHAILNNASARTGNGSDLDYTITGLLTTDTVEVVTGSDIPTIPVNGTLRIGAAQTVYGVTIKRSGVVWAIIPFCEPVVETNLPTRSFDVSGNGHHASCATIASGNVTTQDEYFYLQQHGYSLGSENVLAWNMASWTGDPLLYTALFEGVSLGDAQSANAYLQPTPDGLGCRYTRSAGYNLRTLS